MDKVHTLIYHPPDGGSVMIRIKGIESFLDLDFEIGRICDTSDIDGVVHFFPYGAA